MSITAKQAEQTAQPQSGATAEHTARTLNSTPQGKNTPVKETAFLCRAMRPEDVPACAAIEVAVPDGWSADALAEELAQPTARLFVAEVCGSGAFEAQAGKTDHISFEAEERDSTNPAEAPDLQTPCAQALHTEMPNQHSGTANVPAPLCSPPPQIAALAVFQLVCEEASLYTISTAPTLRRQGAARTLLQYAFAQLAAQGAQTVFLEVRAQNTAARALYTALGFEETGTRRGFYTKPADDAVLMRRTLENS